MKKITFLGAGSTSFAKNVLGDAMLAPALQDAEISLYDIDPVRLDESFVMINSLNRNINEGRSTVTKHLGEENRREALRDADYIVCAVQVGGYKPCTVIDFEIPKKFGLRQTIGDTTGVGGIFRALRTIPVMAGIAEDIEAVCPRALLINYTNPMAMISGYMGRFTKVNTVGICHSVQNCAKDLLWYLDIPHGEPFYDRIAGINHMGWLLEVRDTDGTDLYPEIRRRAELALRGEHPTKGAIDFVRLEYIKRFGYYVTESSEHNAEYNNFFIKSKYPELIERYKIPLDEYPRRCVKQIEDWQKDKEKYISGDVTHKRTKEYASYIMEAMATNVPVKIGGNVINKGSALIPNLPAEACVEVTCLVNHMGVQPCAQPALPQVCAAMNRTEINVHLLTLEAATTLKKEAIYQAVMLDPHASSELSIDDMVAMCDEMIEAHTKAGFLPEYK